VTDGDGSATLAGPGGPPDPPSHRVLERTWRDERADIVATLARRLRDLDDAEEATQDAFARAAVAWPRDGVPTRPGAWLLTTAWRSAIDRRRRTGRLVGDAALDHVAARDAHGDAHGDALPGEDASPLGEPDDLLRLVVTCCHPALASEARVALTLRHVAGLTAREIAAAFVVAEATMEKRLVRARAKLRDAGVRFALPDAHALADRIADVQAVIYLVFTEGHLSAGDGAPVRGALCDDAIWLARRLLALRPRDTETIGLLALCLLHHARTDARHAADGSLVRYDAQDRTRWDTDAIAEARALLARTGDGPLGPYQVEAAIALLHTAAPAADAVPWARIAELHAVLQRLAPSPATVVNRAYAVGRAYGAGAGLTALTPALHEPALAPFAPLHAVHADLLATLGRLDEARTAWERAVAAAAGPAQRAAYEAARERAFPP
jgi:RNA polymerase sigma-70 factor (ECF subfamily)